MTSRVLTLLCLVFLSSACAQKLQLEPARFSQLDGWQRGDASLKHSFAAFLASCEKLATLPYDFSMGVAGTAGDWSQPCKKAQAIASRATPANIQQFFQTEFVPYQASSRWGNREGLFTGYYEPLLRGSIKRYGPYQHALYKRPPDLEKDKEYLGRRRIDVERELSGKNLELLYVDDPVELFFLHVQGSGKVQLEDGTLVGVGYDGKNNCPYTSIGKVLVDRGVFTLEEVTADGIKHWLRNNPDEAQGVMLHNTSYVFFRQIEATQPIGTQGVPLTPEASLAVDRAFIPMGVPVWLETTLPNIGKDETPYRRLFIAQDTGGVIKGPVRGDVFFGGGKRAETLASGMKQIGQYYVLLPKHVKPNG